MQTKEARETDQKKSADNFGQILEHVAAYSGYDMSDVQVHTNASQPAAMDAYAYTQGSDIYLGPGQEAYLPHEAWHVVQQKQERFSGPQYKGMIYENSALENEADRMGKIAASGTAGNAGMFRQNAVLPSDGPILRAKKNKDKTMITTDTEMHKSSLFRRRRTSITDKGLKAVLLVQCQLAYKKYVDEFEVKLGKVFLKNSAVADHANRMIHALNNMLSALHNAGKDGAKLEASLVSSLKVGDQYFGAMKDVRELRRILADARTRNVEKKYKILYESISTGMLPGLLKLLVTQYDEVKRRLSEPETDTAAKTKIKRVDLKSGRSSEYQVGMEFYHNIDSDLVSNMEKGTTPTLDKVRQNKVKEGAEDYFRRSSLFNQSSKLYAIEKMDRSFNGNMSDSEGAVAGYKTYKKSYEKYEEKGSRGKDLYDVLEGGAASRTAAASMSRMLSGVSGTTGMMIPVSDLLGFNTEDDHRAYRLGLAGWMMAGGDHSFYEVFRAAEDILGLTFKKGNELGYFGGEYEYEENLKPMTPKEVENNFSILPSYYMSNEYLQEQISKAHIDNSKSALESYVQYLKDNGLQALTEGDHALDEIQTVYMYKLVLRLVDIGKTFKTEKFTTKYAFGEYRTLKRQMEYVYLANTMDSSDFNKTLMRICMAQSFPPEFVLFIQTDQNKINENKELSEDGPQPSVARFRQVKIDNAKSLFSTMGIPSDLVNSQDPDALIDLSQKLSGLVVTYERPLRKQRDVRRCVELQKKFPRVFLDAVEDALKMPRLIQTNLLTDQELDALNTFKGQANVDEKDLSGSQIITKSFQTENDYWKQIDASINVIDRSWSMFINNVTKKALNAIQRANLEDDEKTSYEKAEHEKDTTQQEKDQARQRQQEILTQINTITSAVDEKTGYSPEQEAALDELSGQYESFTEIIIRPELKAFFELFKQNVRNNLDQQRRSKEDKTEIFARTKIRTAMLHEAMHITLDDKDEVAAAQHSLHERERGAIFNYTSSRYTSYTASEATMKENDEKKGAVIESKSSTFAKPVIAAATSGLSKLPVYRRPVYRISGRPPGDEAHANRKLQKIEIDAEHQYTTLFSTAKSTESAYIRNHFSNKDTLEFITNVKTGHDIENISFADAEREVCFTPGATFRTKNAILLKDYVGNDAEIVRVKANEERNKRHILIEKEEV